MTERRTESQQRDADIDRINWFEEDIDRLEDVRGYIANEGGTVREAIDALRVLQAQDRTLEDQGR